LGPEGFFATVASSQLEHGCGRQQIVNLLLRRCILSGGMGWLLGRDYPENRIAREVLRTPNP
jgi:hypothetical protein